MEKMSWSCPDRRGNNRQSNTDGEFDREYELNELLSISVLEELYTAIQKVAPISIALFTQDSTLFFTKGSFESDDINSFSSIINREKIDSHKTFDSIRWQATIFPITHQLETIGYMVVGNELNRDQTPYATVFLGNFLLKTFTHLIDHKYRYELTAGLHEQVVRESYDRLKKKAVLLENSERRYRQLAESLEIEVQQKTREIKEAQTWLMQQEKMASIGQLAAGVAHEINNPMGFISSNLNTLKEYDKDIRSLIKQYRLFFSGLKNDASKEKDRTYILEGIKHITQFEKDIDIEFVMQDLPNLIEESLDGADRIRKIVFDLKDFAHPEEEELKFTGINENLDSTLNVVWNELKYKANVTKDYGDLPLVKCYPRQLNQVFMNILVNAAQAINEKGEIKIITRSENEQVKISISDTGSGIPEENLSKIFDPFFTTKEVGKGTGLGLNVAYNIIKKHNGTIDVKSALEKGTTFSIQLPSIG